MHHGTRLNCHCEEQSDVAISGRHFQFVQGVDKNAPTDCVCSGAQRAPCRLASYRAASSNAQISGFVIARPRRGRGALSAKREEVPLGCNLGKAVTVSPIAFPRCCRVLRDCHVASLLAMTRQGGAAMHQRPDAVELPCTRRSVSAATDAIGAHHFNDSLYELHCLPEIATSAYGLLAMTSRGLSPF